MDHPKTPLIGKEVASYLRSKKDPSEEEVKLLARYDFDEILKDNDSLNLLFNLWFNHQKNGIRIEKFNPEFLIRFEKEIKNRELSERIQVENRILELFDVKNLSERKEINIFCEKQKIFSFYDDSKHLLDLLGISVRRRSNPTLRGKIFDVVDFLDIIVKHLCNGRIKFIFAEIWSEYNSDEIPGNLRIVLNP